MSDDLVKSLRDRAISAREEGTMTAKVDAIHFEKSADRIEVLEAALKKVVKGAYVDGFIDGAGDGWVNNPRIAKGWEHSRARTALEELKGENHE